MPKPRIRENFRLYKSKVNNYLNNKNVITINDMETELLKQNIISVNFDEYIKKKMSLKNMIYSVIISSLNILFALRFLFEGFIEDDYILKLFADPFRSTGDRMASNISFGIVVLIAIKVRLFLYFK